MTEFYEFLVATGYYNRPSDPGPETCYANPHSHKRSIVIQYETNRHRHRVKKCSVAKCTMMVDASRTKMSGLCIRHAMIAWHRRQGHKITKEMNQ